MDKAPDNSIKPNIDEKNIEIIRRVSLIIDEIQSIFGNRPQVLESAIIWLSRNKFRDAYVSIHTDYDKLRQYDEEDGLNGKIKATLKELGLLD